MWCVPCARWGIRVVPRDGRFNVRWAENSLSWTVEPRGTAALFLSCRGTSYTAARARERIAYWERLDASTQTPSVMQTDFVSSEGLGTQNASLGITRHEHGVTASISQQPHQGFACSSDPPERSPTAPVSLQPPSHGHTAVIASLTGVPHTEESSRASLVQYDFVGRPASSATAPRRGSSGTPTYCLPLYVITDAQRSLEPSRCFPSFIYIDAEEKLRTLLSFLTESSLSWSAQPSGVRQTTACGTSKPRRRGSDRALQAAGLEARLSGGLLTRLSAHLDLIGVSFHEIHEDLHTYPFKLLCLSFTQCPMTFALDLRILMRTPAALEILVPHLRQILSSPTLKLFYHGRRDMVSLLKCFNLRVHYPFADLSVLESFGVRGASDLPLTGQETDDPTAAFCALKDCSPLTSEPTDSVQVQRQIMQAAKLAWCLPYRIVSLHKDPLFQNVARRITLETRCVPLMAAMEHNGLALDRQQLLAETQTSIIADDTYPFLPPSGPRHDEEPGHSDARHCRTANQNPELSERKQNKQLHTDPTAGRRHVVGEQPKATQRKGVSVKASGDRQSLLGCPALGDHLKPAVDHVFILAEYPELEYRIAADRAPDFRLIAHLKKTTEEAELHKQTLRIVGRCTPVANDILGQALNECFVLHGILTPLKAVTYLDQTYSITVNCREFTVLRKRFFDHYLGLYAWHQRLSAGVAPFNDVWSYGEGSESSSCSLPVAKPKKWTSHDVIEGVADVIMKETLGLLTEMPGSSTVIELGARVIWYHGSQLILEVPTDVALRVCNATAGIMEHAASIHLKYVRCPAKTKVCSNLPAETPYGA